MSVFYVAVVKQVAWEHSYGRFRQREGGCVKLQFLHYGLPIIASPLFNMRWYPIRGIYKDRAVISSPFDRRIIHGQALRRS